MIEKVNPCHPDKVADRIAGAIVDLAYTKQKNPKIAVEVLLGHGDCNIIIESSVYITYDEIDEIEFCGLCTDICVISNVLMARQILPEKKITVDASCCAGVTPEKHLAALEVMKSCQIEVIGE